MGSLLAVEKILPLLEAVPGRIAEATKGLTEEQLHAAPAPGEWSANEVLAHLRSCVDMWAGAITRILAEDRPVIKAMNPRTWIEHTDYLQQRFRPSLQVYARQRTQLLALLQPLKPGAWARSATVIGAGKPLVLTVHSYADRLAIHERPHLKQIERIASAFRTAANSP